jgi:hypothetical protein
MNTSCKNHNMYPVTVVAPYGALSLSLFMVMRCYTFHRSVYRPHTSQKPTTLAMLVSRQYST